jgi:hypothetical protein
MLIIAYKEKIFASRFGTTRINSFNPYLVSKKVPRELLQMLEHHEIS